MDGVNRNLHTQAIDLRIQIEESKYGRPLTAKEKQDIINEQLERPATVAGRHYNMAQNGGRGGMRAMTAAAPQTKAIMEEDDSSSGSVSSDWDDWKDPEYIEEQRAALQEFSQKQRDIKTANSTKKKKKKPKKKKNRGGPTTGDALDDDLESEFRSHNDVSDYNTKSRMIDQDDEE